MEDIITVKNLSKKYKINAGRVPYNSLRDTIVKALTFKSGPKKEEFWALDNINFDVKEGESVGIVGRNGAGKSTLLKILSRITPPTKGNIRIKGRVASLLEVGTGFHPELTGRENVFLNGSILGMNKAEIVQKFDEMIDFSGVSKYIDVPIKHYSSGMQLRLAFAVAAFLEPEILVIDEVLAVGDASFQKKCINKMNAVSQESGRTILFVSHNMTAVKTLCSKAVYLENGKLKQVGEVNKVINDYMTEGIKQTEIREWEKEKRPGNRFFKLNKVYATNEQGNTIVANDISKSFYITIEFEVLIEGSQAAFSVVLMDMNEYCAFTTMSNQEKNFYGKKLSLGTYTSTCEIPGDLLNNGRYMVNLWFYGEHFSDAVNVTDVLQIDAIDDGILKGDYQGRVSGAVRPRIDWVTERLG
ncbi:MAG: ABC transporter ATP-binding protein [Flavobacteriales bacterium]|nr:ABC transporter ATP-binding protein [Flavobacteriales bacterium]